MYLELKWSIRLTFVLNVVWHKFIRFLCVYLVYRSIKRVHYERVWESYSSVRDKIFISPEEFEKHLMWHLTGSVELISKLLSWRENRRCSRPPLFHHPLPLLLLFIFPSDLSITSLSAIPISKPGLVSSEGNLREEEEEEGGGRMRFRARKDGER